MQTAPHSETLESSVRSRDLFLMQGIVIPNNARNVVVKRDTREQGERHPRETALCRSETQPTGASESEGLHRVL